MDISIDTKIILKIQDAKGFTLIEILLVVAIIGILAAVAIPQFLAHRISAYNSAAFSDINNLQKTQLAISIDRQSFGMSINTGAVVAALGNGVILTGTGGLNEGLATVQSFMPVSVSQRVELVANTNAAGFTYTVLAKHGDGTRIYGIDSDRAATYSLISTPGLTLTASGVNAGPVQFNLDFPAGAGWF